MKAKILKDAAEYAAIAGVEIQLIEDGFEVRAFCGETTRCKLLTFAAIVIAKVDAFMDCIDDACDTAKKAEEERLLNVPQQEKK